MARILITVVSDVIKKKKNRRVEKRAVRRLLNTTFIDEMHSQQPELAGNGGFISGKGSRARRTPHRECLLTRRQAN